MALGGVLGTRADINIGLGSSRGKTNYSRYGSPLRAGTARPSAAAAAGPEPDFDSGARQAMRAAESARVANSRSGASENPYMPPSPAATEDPTKGMKELGGGSMGLRPDFTARDEAQRQLEATAMNPPGWLERAITGDDGYYDKLRGLAMKRDAAEKKALEDAAWARAADPRYETWIDTKDTDAQGRRLQVSSQDPNKTRVKTFEEVYREEMEGPNRPGEYTPPTREVTRRDYVYDPRIAEIKTQAERDQEKDDRAYRKAMALQEAENYAALQRDRAGVAARHGAEMSEIAARGAEAAKLAGTKADLKTSPEPAPRDELARHKALALRAAGVMTEAGFDALAPEDRAAAYKAADEAMSQRDPMQGRKLGQVVLPPAAAERVKKLPPGKKLVFTNGQAWINDNGTPRQVK